MHRHVVSGPKMNLESDSGDTRSQKTYQVLKRWLSGTESYENVLSILCSGNPDSMMFIAYSSKPYYHG